MSAITTAIVIPARNEARRIGACLAALQPQLTPACRVVLVANNCTDATVARARAALAEPQLQIITLKLEPGQGVGTARRIGCQAALA